MGKQTHCRAHLTHTFIQPFYKTVTKCFFLFVIPEKWQTSGFNKTSTSAEMAGIQHWTNTLSPHSFNYKTYTHLSYTPLLVGVIKGLCRSQHLEKNSYHISCVSNKHSNQLLCAQSPLYNVEIELCRVSCGCGLCIPVWLTSWWKNKYSVVSSNSPVTTWTKSSLMSHLCLLCVCVHIQ